MEVINQWDALPEECKLIILSHLSIKELACLARVSKEFLRTIYVVRSYVELLVLPLNLSLSSLEGMVIVHPNLKSLSFEQYGSKLKAFVPIIKAAASGYIREVENVNGLGYIVKEKKKTRSLTNVCFKNCTNLIDTDVSILCSLHSRLQEVDLTNCPFITDTTLLTLSRYRCIEKPSDPLEKYNCYPRVFDKASKSTSNLDTFTELDELFLKDNDIAVFEEIQGLGLNSYNSQSWSKVGERSRKEFAGHSQFNNHNYEEGKLMATSPNCSILRRGDSYAATNANTRPKKCQAQMTIVTKPIEKLKPTTCFIDAEIEKRSCFVDLKSEKNPITPHYLQCIQSDERHSSLSFIDKTSIDSRPRHDIYRDPTLTFIDWSLCDLKKNTQSDYGNMNDKRLLTSSQYCSMLSTMLVDDDKWNSEIATTNKYRDMYKHYLIDEVENSSCALPDLIDNLCLQSVNAKDLSMNQAQKDHEPTTIHVDQYGTKYNTLETPSSNNQMMRTQTSLFIPKITTDKGSGISIPKSTCIADRTEIQDQRVQINLLGSSNSTIVTPNDNSEALCRTVNHVGIFAIPNASSKFDLISNVDQICEHTSNRNFLGNKRHMHSTLRKVENSSQLSIHLPSTSNIDAQGILRTNMKHLLLENPLEDINNDAYQESFGDSNQSIGLSMTNGSPKLDLKIDVSKNISGLKIVCIANCHEVTDRGVQALLKGASRTCLLTLDVSRCASLTSAGLKLPTWSRLQQLIAIQMPSIMRLVYHLPTQSCLQHLNLAGCYKLEEFMLVSSSLKTLNLSNCKKLMRLRVKCPSLLTLNLSLCDSLERFINFHCNALQSLNVMGCRTLLQSSLNIIVDLATSLKELHCGGCDCVERLDLVQSTLLTLDISGSQSLKRLFCQSKVLRVVDACGCKNLVEVYLYSPYLRHMLFSNCALLQILVIPLDAIKEKMDDVVSHSRRVGGAKLDDLDLEISISGCNMPEAVKRNLAKLIKQWHTCFK